MATEDPTSLCVAEAGERSFQPFQCRICQSRFTRHENLKRHAALHTRSRDDISYSCDLCSTNFSRRDLLHRHMKRKHAEHAEAAAAKRTRRSRITTRERSGRRRSQGAEAFSESSTESQGGSLPQPWVSDTHVPMNSGAWTLELPEEQDYNYPDYHSPTSSDSSTNATGAPATPPGDGPNSDAVSRQAAAIDLTRAGLCAQSPHELDLDPISLDTSALDFTHLGAPVALNEAGSFECISSIPDGLSPRGMAFLQQIDWCPSAAQVARGLDLYFTYVSHFVPFLHQPTFDATRASRCLILSMLCLAYQYGEDPACDDEEGSGEGLSHRCFHQARVLLASEEDTDKFEDDPTRNIETVQAYLLLEIAAVMYFCGSDSAHGLKMHHKMISVARFSGLTQIGQPGAAAARDLDSLWVEFVKTESYKRTILAAHQIDALWYQLLSMPRSLSHLEIKHELPCPADCWAASSAAEWALRQLTRRNSSSTPSMQYADAVRCFLSSHSELDLLPAFDPYGAINIAHFLLSSAREVSGWSAITGRLSLDRLEPLRASLVALGPFIRPQTGSEIGTPPFTALQEATWEIAMIELQIWSQSHTCGRIEGSVDAVLKEATVMASSGEISFGVETAQAAQPHIAWFLRYLDAPQPSESDPPWISLYAYKAFLLAWQLVRKGIPCAMKLVGVQDGDTKGAIDWAREVFGRRRRRRIGRLITECLDLLTV